MIRNYFIVAIPGYFLGSIPFGYILVKLFLKKDIRTTGSGNIGATNVARSGAKGLAIATLLLDAAKGWVAVAWLPMCLLGFGIGWDWPLLASLAALCAILGHCFPVWLKFRGGKGVATGAGAFLALEPKGVLVVLILFLIVVALTRFVSLGSVIATAAFPFATYFLNSDLHRIEVFSVILASSTIIILKHHENIRRLIAGTESKFGGKKTIPPPDVMEKQA